jgi:hypothetical protein
MLTSSHPKPLLLGFSFSWGLERVLEGLSLTYIFKKFYPPNSINFPGAMVWIWNVPQRLMCGRLGSQLWCYWEMVEPIGSGA